MYSKEPVWLLPEEILRRYEEFCFLNNITERRIVRLFDAFLLRGRGNRNSRKVEILLESFEELMGHIEYNLFWRTAKNGFKLVQKPKYLKHQYSINNDNQLNWYTPSEALQTYYNILRNETYFTCEFIGELVQMGLIIGKYSPKEHCYYLLLNSIAELIYFRDYSVRQYMLMPPDEPTA